MNPIHKKLSERKNYRNSYNFVGKKFGVNKVLKQVKERYISPQGKKHIQWFCICTLCGNTKITTTNNLSMGRADSCQCLSFTPEIIERRAKGNIRETAGFVEALGNYRRGAIKRNYVFELNDKQAMNLFKGNCYYCNDEPNTVITKSKIPFVYNGIDRVDNNIGYVYSNCVSCCKICNRMKLSLEEKEFINQIKKIYEHKRP